MNPLRVVRLATVAICVVGIAGMIVGSLDGNNNGAVVTFGLIAAVSILVLMAVAATSQRLPGGPGAIDEVVAERVEGRIARLVAAGADEEELRDLVRDTLRLRRGR
jgi:hypothetical protein